MAGCKYRLRLGEDERCAAEVLPLQKPAVVVFNSKQKALVSMGAATGIAG